MSLTLPADAPAIEANAATPRRITQFDGLRAVAFLAVFLHHARHVPLLWAGVDVFFVLSGFLITGILLERKRRGGPYFSVFYRRRMFRILPPLLVTVCLYGFAVTWTQFHPFWLFLLAPNVHAAFLPWSPPFLPFWSLGIEEQFYFVWPLVVLLIPEKWLLRVAMAALVVTPVLRMVCAPFFPGLFYIYALTPFRADVLCAGAVLAILWKQRTRKLEEQIALWAPWLFFGGFGLLAVSQIFRVFRLASNTVLSNGFVYLFTEVGALGLVSYVLLGRGMFVRFLNLRAVRCLGEISYTMYLVHIVVSLVVERRLGNHLWVKPINLLLTIGYATVSWFAMERPLIAYAARRPGSAKTGGNLDKRRAEA